MFDFAEQTKEMSAVEILNHYRNLYYAEPQVTERGIVANAINEVLPNVAPKSEVAKEVINNCIEILNDVYRKCDANDVKTILVIVNAIAELKKKYKTE